MIVDPTINDHYHRGFFYSTILVPFTGIAMGFFFFFFFFFFDDLIGWFDGLHGETNSNGNGTKIR